MLPDREAAKRALTFFRSLIEAKLVPTSSWPGKTDSAPLFKTGVTALIIPPAATATGTFMMRQYMVGIPDEMLEDARIDGASDWEDIPPRYAAIVGSGAGGGRDLKFYMAMERLSMAPDRD